MLGILLFLVNLTFSLTSSQLASKPFYKVYSADTVLKGSTQTSNTISMAQYGWQSIFIYCDTTGYGSKDSINVTLSYATAPIDSTRLWNCAKWNTIATITDTVAQFYQLYMPVSTYMKFRIVGNTGIDLSKGINVQLKAYNWEL